MRGIVIEPRIFYVINQKDYYLEGAAAALMPSLFFTS